MNDSLILYNGIELNTDFDQSISMMNYETDPLGTSAAVFAMRLMFQKKEINTALYECFRGLGSFLNEVSCRTERDPASR